MRAEERIAESLQATCRAMHHGAGASGLTPALHALLRRLERQGPQGVTDLARQLGVLPSSVTVASQKLERLRLVERRKAARDERRVVLALTEEGQAALAANRQRRAERLRRAISTLTREERATLSALLRRVEEALLAQAGEAGEERAAP